MYVRNPRRISVLLREHVLSSFLAKHKNRKNIIGVHPTAKIVFEHPSFNHALPLFYLFRELTRSYQASTMRLLNNYVRESAPGYLPLSAECRNTTLGLRASSAFIFDEVRMEILAKRGGSKRTTVST